MSIYDIFVNDEEWSKTNEMLHLPDLTYRERDSLRAKMDTIEDRIRKAEAVKFKRLCDEYKEGHHGNS